MNFLNILAVLVLLFIAAEVDSNCESFLLTMTKTLTEALTQVKETKTELKKVKAELEAEKNKSDCISTTEKPEILVVLYECTFENISSCGYTQKNNEAKMMIGQGKVAENTGPKADHTLGTATGHYLYINGEKEANRSVFEFSRTAHVKFPPIVPKNTSEICISFWYSMYGKDVKSLKFYIEEDKTENQFLVFAKYGNNGPDWKFFKYELPKRKEKFSFSFQATTLAYKEDDYVHNKIIFHNKDCNVAIDDIQVRASPCRNETISTTMLG